MFDVYVRWNYNQKAIAINEKEKETIRKEFLRDRETVDGFEVTRAQSLFTLESVVSLVASKHDNVEVSTNVVLIGETIQFSQVFDFIMRTDHALVCLIEATQLGFDVTYARALIGCDIAAERFKMDVVYGIVFTGWTWALFRSGNDVIHENQVSRLVDMVDKLNAILTLG